MVGRMANIELPGLPKGCKLNTDELSSEKTKFYPKGSRADLKEIGKTHPTLHQDDFLQLAFKDTRKCPPLLGEDARYVRGALEATGFVVFYERLWEPRS